MNPTATKLKTNTAHSHPTSPHQGGITCDKCGLDSMIDDSYSGIEVYKCWVCGNRMYAGYPKRSGTVVCLRCGRYRTEENELGYCGDCLRVLNVHADQANRGVVSSS